MCLPLCPPWPPKSGPKKQPCPLPTGQAAPSGRGIDKKAPAHAQLARQQAPEQAAGKNCHDAVCELNWLLCTQQQRALRAAACLSTLLCSIVSSSALQDLGVL